MLLKKLYDLNISVLQIGTPEYDTISEGRKFLNLTYNMDSLIDFSQRINEALTGPIGKYYWEQKPEIVSAFVNIIIEDYISPVKRRIDEFLELMVQKEFSNDFEEKLIELVYQTK